MKILNLNFISQIIRKFIPVLWLSDKNDDFENESFEGLQLFPPSQFKMFRIRLKIRLLLFQTIWAALSIPVKIFAVSGCIAVAYSSIYVTSFFPEINEKNDISLYQYENSNRESKSNEKKLFSENEIVVITESEFSDYNSGFRLPNTAEKIPFMSTRPNYNIKISKDTISSIRFSSFPELIFNNFRFVDFSQLYTSNKPLLIPLLGGLEAQYENDKEFQFKETFTMADTISYLSFLEKLSVLLMNRNFNEAEYMLNLLIRQRPDDENGLFYQGYVHYCREEYAPAINYFLKCEHAKFKSFYHEARFQRAFLLYLSHQNEKALKLIESIENENSHYSKNASALKIKIIHQEQQ